MVNIRNHFINKIISFEEDTRDRKQVDLDLKQKLTLPDDTNTAKIPLEGIRRFGAKEMLTQYALKKLHLYPNKNGGESLVLGFGTRDHVNYSSTNITRPTFRQACATIVLNSLIQLMSPDCKYTTLIVHRGPGINLVTQSYG